MCAWVLHQAAAVAESKPKSPAAAMFSEEWDFDMAIEEQVAVDELDLEPALPEWPESLDTSQSVEPSATDIFSGQVCVSAQVSCEETPVKRALPLAETPIVRRRLRTKTSQSPVQVEASGSGKVPMQDLERFLPGVKILAAAGGKHFGQSSWEGMTVPIWSGMELRARYFFVYNKFRRWIQKLAASLPSCNECSQEVLTLVQKAANDWKRLARTSKGLAMQIFVEVTGAPEHLREFVADTWPTEESDTDFLCARTVLLTWNGAWGHVSPPPVVQSGTTEAAVVRAVKADKSMLQNWQGFQEFLQGVAKALGAESWCCSFEVCGRTFEQEGECRVHGHAFLKSSCKMRCRQATPLLFRGSKPNKAGHAMGHQLRSTGTYAGSCGPCGATPPGSLSLNFQCHQNGFSTWSRLASFRTCRPRSSWCGAARGWFGD